MITLSYISTSDHVEQKWKPFKSLIVCFEPFNINTSNLLEGLDSGECILGGKQIVDGVKIMM